MTTLTYPDWKEKIVYSPTGPQPFVLYEDVHLKVVVAGLVAGQKIPPHPAGQAVYHFLEGNGWMTVNDERFNIKAGATVITKADDSRGIEADSDLAFFASKITLPVKLP
ncbi:MAG: hypothetical protein OEY93_12060 [Anaerolineae bacterium]|nr:hypothetical protein [Anaerolineae bacterium]